MLSFAVKSCSCYINVSLKVQEDHCEQVEHLGSLECAFKVSKSCHSKQSFKGARTNCVTNEVPPRGVVTMDHFSSLKPVTNTLPHPQHYLVYILLLCKNSIG